MNGDDAWQPARLIPTSGINGAEEQERRATSALLAVITSVNEFGRRLISPLGAPGGSIETFIEVPFLLGDKKVIPDGLIRTAWGKKSWVALVEVKTGDNDLGVEQIENYLDVARTNGFDAVITISNEIASQTGVHPTPVDKRKLSKVALHHWSWSEVLTNAVLQRQFKGVSDPDQAWILGELIRYLEHPRSGALSFHDMGQSWVAIRNAISTGTLRRNDKGLVDVASRFDALVAFTCLMLGRRLGVQVAADIPRAQAKDPKLRTDTLVAQLVDEGAISGSIRVPNMVAPIYVRANLKSGQVMCSVELAAPTTGKAQTRVNWLLRQLKNAPPSTRVEAFAARSREGTAELLGDARVDPGKLVADPRKDIVRFRVAQLSAAGAGRGLGRNSFIDSVLKAVDDFYENIGQALKAYVPPTPKFRDQEANEPTPRDVAASTAETSSGRQPAEAPPASVD
ncbi:hypothetical protein GCM10027568_00270 [Humibacter soli]